MEIGMHLEQEQHYQPLMTQGMVQRLDKILEQPYMDLWQSHLQRRDSRGDLFDPSTYAVRKIKEILEHGYTIHAVMGKMSSGKGADAEGFYQLLTEIKKQCHLNFEIIVAPSNLTGVAAMKLPAKSKYHLDPNRDAGSTRKKDLRRISCFSTSLIRQAIEPRLLNPKKNPFALILEGSPGFCLPTSQTPPVKLEGVADMLTSTIVDLALDPRLAKVMDIDVIDRVDSRYGEPAGYSIDFREGLAQKDPEVLNGPVKVYIKLNGQLVALNLADLPDSVRQGYIEFLAKCGATPKGVQRWDRIHQEYLNNLYQTTQISEPTQSAWVEVFQQRLPMVNINEVYNIPAGERPKMVPYYLESLPVKKYPEIIPSPLQEFLATNS